MCFYIEQPSGKTQTQSKLGELQFEPRQYTLTVWGHLTTATTWAGEERSLPLAIRMSCTSISSDSICASACTNNKVS